MEESRHLPSLWTKRGWNRKIVDVQNVRRVKGRYLGINSLKFENRKLEFEFDRKTICFQNLFQVHQSQIPFYTCKNSELWMLQHNKIHSVCNFCFSCTINSFNRTLSIRFNLNVLTLLYLCYCMLSIIMIIVNYTTLITLKWNWFLENFY